MVKNFLTTAWRLLLRNKQFTAINILGLAVGLASCLVITGYVLHELSFENGHANKDRIYRTNGRTLAGGGSIYNAAVVAPLGPAAKETIPEVEHAVRIAGKYDVALSVDGAMFAEKRIYFTEPEAFDVFTFPLVRGNARTALEAPFSLVIDEGLARTYFGNVDPVGRTVRVKFGTPYDFQVTGVMKALPTNTVLHVRMLASFSSLEKLTGDQLALNLNAWRAFGLYYTFLELRPGADPRAVEAKIAALIKTPLGEDAEKVTYSLQPLKDIYLQAPKIHISNDFTYSGSPTRILIFATIAFLILLLAGINFVNLSLAKVSQRLKDVGIRKTCGAARRNLMAQFLTESLLLSSAAMAVGLLLFQVFKLPIDAFLGQTLSFGRLDNPALLAVVGGLVVAVGVLAGSYPGLVLARYPAQAILKSGGPLVSFKSTLRRILVIFQFFIAIALTACTLGVVAQVRFAETRDPGFNKSGLLALKAQEAADAPKMKLLQSELLARTGVVDAALISSVPAGQNRWMTNMKPADKQDEKERLVQLVAADAHFVPAFGIKVIQGRNFEAGRGADKAAILLNETAAKSFGLQNPVGSRFIVGQTTMEVVGVVRDFNTNSIHSPIYPVAILPAFYDLPTLCLRIRPGKGSETIGQIRAVWNEIFPTRPFSSESVEDIVDRAYDNEKKLAGLMFAFCGLAVLVAALGIFGLAAFIGEQRTKEIGVRKVLGATVSQIVTLMTKSFARWVLAANVLAWPVAYFALNKWLQSFAFRTPIGPWPFLISGLLTLAIATLTVSYQAIKAALSDPVNSLRYE
ncbi:MAG: ABC transporter permease [Candidatus Aminicenantes bacterium]|nr:ABC transporter permease [Candidatus Aminicenantes bacterium]